MLNNQVNSEQCEVQEVKSSKGTYVSRHYDYRTRQWVGGRTQYSTLYKYALCTNPSMETGKQIFIASAQDNYKYIIFKNGTIPVVPTGIFTSLTSVVETYLNSSKIETIEPGAFNGMTKLEELHLENNNIKEIVRGTLNSLTHLKRLNISQNELKRIEDNSFHGLLNLEELKLSHNQLTNITSFTFSSLNNLSYLDLSYNFLSVVDDTSFSSMNKLTQLILSNNLLTSIPTLQNLQTLQLLVLCYNKIEEIDFSIVPGMRNFNSSFNGIKLVKNWSKMENTEIVDITHNKIAKIHAIGKGILHLSMKQNNLEVLGATLFSNSVDLSELNLSYNTITEIDGNAFKGLSKLNYLSLSNNNLKYLSIGIFKDLVTLKYLYLSYNSLINLEFGTFAGIPKLNSLYLDHNSFINIHENSFHVFDQMEVLTLNDNNIQVIDTSDILNHLKLLKYINLNNNNWTCNSLLNIINAFKNRNVNVSKGDDFDVPNIDGIPCTNEISTQSENKSNVLHPQITSNENNLEKFFERDFYNTSFYKYFKQDFKNSTFYTFFTKEFLNYTQNELLNTKFFEFFNQDFVNSSFFNYLTQNLKNKEVPLKEPVINTNISNDKKEDGYASKLVEIKRLNEIENMDMFADKIIILISIMIVLLFFVIIILLSLFFYIHSKEKRSRFEIRKFATEADMELI